MKLPAIFWMLSVSVLAAASDPGATAVEFLEKVRSKKLDLEPGGDTALSPQTSVQKRREIARRLERMAADLGQDPLEVGAMKLDEELAAVLVRKMGGFDPNRLRVFPVALVKRGDQWSAAPVPASFENSGVGYAALLRQRLAALEDWMLREQAVDLEQLRGQSADRMRRKIAESLPPTTLRSFSATQAAERFVKACEQHNLAEMFGLLGGLAANLPADWPLRLKAAEAAVAAAGEVGRPWRLLMAGEVMRAQVHHEEEGGQALVSIACLDPAGVPGRSSLPRIELVHLELSKSADGLWRIDPPQGFLEPRVASEEMGGDDFDSELLDAFPARLAGLQPAAPQVTAELAQQALLTSLQDAASPADLLRWVRLDVREPKTARQACIQAARLWWALHEPAAVRSAMPLALRQEGSKAAGAIQLFSSRDPDQLDLRVLYFEKSAGGWYWTPAPRPATELIFREWKQLQSRHWQNAWQDALLLECPKLSEIPAAAAPPSDEQSIEVVQAWLAATREGDVKAALHQTARLDMADSQANLLRNLGYEMIGADRSSQVPTIQVQLRRGVWCAVGTRSAPSDPRSFRFYPIIATPLGPRILLEIDLFAGGSRSRDFLNKTALNRLRKASRPAAEDLAALFADYQAQTPRL